MELKINISEEDYKAVGETPGCQELTDRLYDAVSKGVVMKVDPKPDILKVADVFGGKLRSMHPMSSSYWPSESGQAVLITMEDLYENMPNDAKLTIGYEKDSSDYGDYFILADGDHVTTMYYKPNHNGGLVVDRKVIDRIHHNDFDGCTPIRESVADSYTFGGPLCDVGRDDLELTTGYYFSWVVKGKGFYDSRTVSGWGKAVAWDTRVVLIHV